MASFCAPTYMKPTDVWLHGDAIFNLRMNYLLIFWSAHRYCYQLGVPLKLCKHPTLIEKENTLFVVARQQMQPTHL